MVKGVNIHIIQYVAITGSIVFIASVLFLISRRKLREEFSLLWLFFGFVFLVLSIWRRSLDIIASFLGIAYAPAAIFLILIIGVIAILIHFSIAISGLTERVKTLVQEVGLLKMEKDRKNQKKES
ncbi:MAG: hypothetical protein COX52_14825 [Syntrophobacterales bacterium CG23_combo_of_CG06-09_8_20_14_all_48_27]|nr:MAG: hypothetical protein COX52_14825 [Syntrophobacterales bacterium CG23_combo_of_CG06-09_8_20_14_all_48_27]